MKDNFRIRAKIYLFFKYCLKSMTTYLTKSGINMSIIILKYLLSRTYQKIKDKMTGEITED